MAEQKTIGQKLYELINPCKAGDPIRPAMWDEVDEDYHAHYERAAAAFLNSEAAASAVWDQAVAKCISEASAYREGQVGNLEAPEGEGAACVYTGAVMAASSIIDLLRSLKLSDKTESDNG